jgi:hypothetical protein
LLVHVEAGISLKALYQALDQHQLPDGSGSLGLITMSASSTMTLARAFSTGSHGGDMWLAPLADSVAAIHLVGAGGTQAFGFC